MKPRPYQLEGLAHLQEHARSPSKGAILAMSAGTGKTLTAMLYAQHVPERGGRVLWLAERRELVLQAAETARRLGLEPGLVGNQIGSDYDAPLICALQRSCLYRLDPLVSHGPFDLVVCDEVHHAHTNSGSWTRVLDWLKEHGAKQLVGLTATPHAEAGSLTDRWKIAFQYSMIEAIGDGFLLPVYAAVDRPGQLDLSRVGRSAQDYLPAELEAELLRAHIVEHTVSSLERPRIYERLPLRDDCAALDPIRATPGSILVFCATVHQAELTTTALVRAGWRAILIHGGTDKTVRAEGIEAFKARRIQIIVNVAVFTEGTDLPIANTIVIARPTTSWPLFVQMIGRGTRLHAGQDRCRVVDLVGCTEMHSLVSAPVLVDGTDCEESPDGRHRYLQQATGEMTCQHCSHTLPCRVHGAAHTFSAGQCACGARQCAESPNREHHWVAWEKGVRMCIYCGMLHPDPITAMVGRVNPPPLPVHWARLRTPGEVWASHLGPQGILFNHMALTLWSESGGPLWYPSYWDGRQMKMLTRSAVSAPMSRLVTNDIARRATKIRGQYGGRRKQIDLELAMRRALRVWEEHAHAVDGSVGGSV